MESRYSAPFSRPQEFPHTGKYPDGHQHPDDRPPNPSAEEYADGDGGRPKTFKRVCVRFAERTSMQGVPYINVSKTWCAKCIWSFVFLTALTLMVLHLFVLFKSFYAFPKQTKVDLGFSDHRFPAVTICNVNPVRKSSQDLGGKKWKDFLSRIDPKKVIESLKKQGKLTQNQGSTTNTPTTTTSRTKPARLTTAPPRLNTRTNKPTTKKPTRALSIVRRTRMFENLEFNFTNPKRQLTKKKPDRLKLSDEKSNLQEIQNEFIYLFSSLERDVRIAMGHSLSDMLVSCTFAGYVCNESHFNIHPTSRFGNCYTLENTNFISYKSGPRDGLELILFLENNEYINTISGGNGAQIEIHNDNTLANPEVDGMAVSAAMETNIAMRVVQIERLGQPWGYCDDGVEFQARYGKRYTRQACQTFCVHEKIVSKCGCYDEEKQELYNNLKSNGSNTPPCRTTKEVKCLLDIETSWETRKFTCKCDNPCSERIYQRILHTKLWPSDEYARMLVEHMCNTINISECERFRKMNQITLNKNFMKVNIYFEDLNYENITEVPDYEEVQFMSDVGGTVGLWVGLSMLSIVEVAQFIFELVHFLTCVRTTRREATTRGNAASQTT